MISSLGFKVFNCEMNRNTSVLVICHSFQLKNVILYNFVKIMLAVAKVIDSIAGMTFPSRTHQLNSYYILLWNFHWAWLRFYFYPLHTKQNNALLVRNVRLFSESTVLYSSVLIHSGGKCLFLVFTYTDVTANLGDVRLF